MYVFINFPGYLSEQIKPFDYQNKPNETENKKKKEIYKR